MKRKVIVVVALCLIVLVSTTAAQAQEVLTLSEPTPVADIVETIAEQIGYTVNWQPSRTTAMFAGGDINTDRLLPTIDNLVSPHGYEVSVVGRTLDIRLKPTAATQRAMPSTTPAVQVPQPGLARPRTLREANAAMGRMAYAQQMAFAPNTSYYGSGVYSGQYGYDFFNPFAYRDFSNQDKYGLLKIDGPDRFLRQVRVVIDGYDASVASKSNNSWNEPIILTAGPHIIEFVRENRTGIVAFQRRVNVVPMSVQREPAWLRVSGNEFENAREAYSYRQHRYIEQASGQVMPQP